jgi:hypothetical protein
MVPRETCGPKGQEVARDWRKLRNEELHNLYSIPNINRVIKPKAMRWVRHVARNGGREIQTGFWWERMKGRYHLEDLAIDGSKVRIKTS